MLECNAKKFVHKIKKSHGFNLSMQKAIWPILKELFVIGLIELIRLSCGMLVSSDRLVKVQGCSKYGYGHSS